MPDQTWGTAGEWEWIVPDDVTVLGLEVYGACLTGPGNGVSWEGVAIPHDPLLGPTGVPVTPGDVVTIRVGGTPTDGVGGFNGGGAGTGMIAPYNVWASGGCGASDVSINGELVIVGGGAGGDSLIDAYDYGGLGSDGLRSDFPDLVTTLPDATEVPRVPWPHEGVAPAGGPPPAAATIMVAGQPGGERTGADGEYLTWFHDDGDRSTDVVAYSGAGGGGYGGGASASIADWGATPFVSYFYAGHSAGRPGASWVHPDWASEDPRVLRSLYGDTFVPGPYDGLVIISHDGAVTPSRRKWHTGRIAGFDAIPGI